MEILGMYLLIGLGVLFLLNIITGRIQRNLVDASYETQSKLINAGFALGRKTSVVVTALAVWIFWPVTVYGAIESAIKGKEKNDKSS